MNLETQLLIITFIVSAICGLVIIPILKKLKIGQIERDDGPESHLKKQGTSTMGGLIMISAIILVVSGTYIYLSSIGKSDLAIKILPLLIMTIGFGIIGFIDDFKKLVLKNTEGLKPRYKMLGLLLIGIAYIIFLIQVLKIGTSTYIPIFKKYIELPIYIYIPFAICVILATTNAINFTDGIDGLSSSVSAIIITCLTVIGIRSFLYEISIFGSIVIGAILGFLIYNIHPAKIFMGDTGSLMLGGVISGMSLYLKNPLLLMFIAVIPVVETLSVIMQVTYFKKTGNRIFKMAPLHHHYELSGWKENKVVVVFSLITLFMCFLGIQVL